MQAVLALVHPGDVSSDMAQIIIRQLDDAVVARLRERAAAAGRSMEQEVREILTSVCTDLEAIVSRLRQRQQSDGGRVFSDSAAIVRQMRDDRVR
jgi:antitoxin FitA